MQYISEIHQSGRPRKPDHLLTEPSAPAFGVRFTAQAEFQDRVLTSEAAAFLGSLHRRFAQRVAELLEARGMRQAELNAGALPDFPRESRELRESEWRAAPAPADLQDRRVEITGPVDRKMIINALNSGARVFMADFEDAHSPTWAGTLAGQANLMDAVDRSISFTSPAGKVYCLNDRTATLVVRPRGWHLTEKHCEVDGEPIPAALFDFGLFFFHNARRLIDRGTGPYFYLPKLEGRAEARLWNDVFNFAQDELGLARGTIKATVLIETILAAFEMDEILFELRDHIVGLNCGRWDYIFSVIKKFRAHPEFVLPERGRVTMTTHFLHAYSRLLIQTCHCRGVHAMGGMAAQIPVKDDPDANAAALAKVREDKEREAGDGHDGTWVAHPGLVPLATQVFDAYMPGPNQIAVKREALRFTARDLLTIPEGPISESGLRGNIDVGVQYLEAWLNGVGCAPIHNLMEDAATAEIARSQIWQWIRHPGGVLDDGRRITVALFRSLMAEELERIRIDVGDARFDGGKFDLAASLIDEIIVDDNFAEFLTNMAYEYIA